MAGLGGGGGGAVGGFWIMLSIQIVNQFNLCSCIYEFWFLHRPHLFWSCWDIKTHHKHDDVTFIKHVSWKFVPLGGKTGKKLWAQIDIINLILNWITNWFSLSYYYTILWMIDNFHFQLARYAICYICYIC